MADSHTHSSRRLAQAVTGSCTNTNNANAEAPSPRAHVNLERCRLSLIKGEHRWRFRWEPGSEAALISAVADLARNPRMNFDWFDAAVMSYQMGRRLEMDLEDVKQ